MSIFLKVLPRKSTDISIFKDWKMLLSRYSSSLLLKFRKRKECMPLKDFGWIIYISMLCKPNVVTVFSPLKHPSVNMLIEFSCKSKIFRIGR